MFDVNWDDWEWQQSQATPQPLTSEVNDITSIDPMVFDPMVSAGALLAALVAATSSSTTVTALPQYRYAPSFSFSPLPRLSLTAIDQQPLLVHRHLEPMGFVTVDPKELFGGTNMASLGRGGNQGSNPSPSTTQLAPAVVLMERGRSQLLGSLPMDFTSFSVEAIPEVPEAIIDDVPQVAMITAGSDYPRQSPVVTPSTPQPPPLRKRARLEVTSTTTTTTSPLSPSSEDAVSYPCLECDKQFKRLEHLKRHIRLVHLNIRPFHCTYCDKKFSRLDNLAQHLKTHYRTDSLGNTSVVYGNPSQRKRKLSG